MAIYRTNAVVNSATATTVHTAGQAEELVAIRIVATSTTAAQAMKVIRRVSGPTDYTIGWVTVAAKSSVGGANGAPFSTTFTLSKMFLDNTDIIQLQSENTDVFNIEVITRDPVI